MLCLLGRSGGTLTLRLLDGHPQLAVYPIAYRTGLTDRHAMPGDWPDTTIPAALRRDPARAWRTLCYDPRWPAMRRQGYRKKWDRSARRDTYDVSIDIIAHWRAFRSRLGKRPTGNEGFTAGNLVMAGFEGFFAGWREGAVRDAATRYTVFHYADPLSYRTACANFLEALPNGRIVTVIREPLSWAASYLHAKGSRTPLDELLEQYRALMDDLLVGPSDPRRLVVPFEKLVRDTEASMRALARFLDIDMDDRLLVPTLNRNPTKPNTSFPDNTTAGSGIVPEVTERGRLLDDATRWRVEGALSEVYDEVMRRFVPLPGRSPGQHNRAEVRP